MTFNLLTSVEEQHTEWQTYWANAHNISPYHWPQYGQLSPGFQVSVWQTPGFRIWYPVVVTPSPASKKPTWHVESPYGLSGPLVQGIGEVTGFWQAWQHHCRQAAYATEFVRFNPLLENHTPWQSCFNLFSPKDCVCVTLPTAFHPRLRRGLRQAEKAGLRVQTNVWDDWPLFINHYSQLMVSKQTPDLYRFSPAYWSGLQAFLQAGHGVLHTVWQQGNCLGGCVFLYQGCDAYYHLGAISPEGKALKASPFSLAQGIDAAFRRGATRVFLGGGVQADDSLQAFKQQFAPDAPLLPYIVGKTHQL